MPKKQRYKLKTQKVNDKKDKTHAIVFIGSGKKTTTDLLGVHNRKLYAFSSKSMDYIKPIFKRR